MEQASSLNQTAATIGPRLAQTRWRRVARHAALLLFTALILWWFGRSLDWAEVQRSMKGANALLLSVSAALMCLTYLLRAYRWRALLAPVTETNVRELFLATNVGFSAVFLLGRAGEVVRPAVLSLRDRRVPPAASFITIMVERIFDMTAVIVLFALNLLWLRVPSVSAEAMSRVRWAGALVLLTAFLGIAILIRFKKNSETFICWMDGKFMGRKFAPERLRLALTGTLKQLAAALSVLSDRREFLRVALWTLAQWATIILATQLILRSFSLQLGLSETIFLFGWGMVGSLAPTPGGAVGAFHAATVAGLMFMGVARDEAAAATIILHLFGFLPALAFGFFHLLRGDLNLTRLRGIISGPKETHV